MNNKYANTKVLVTGASGFIGSHLVDRLLKEGAIVTGVDNFITGNKTNLKSASENPNFTLIEADASQPVDSYLSPNAYKLKPISYLFHFASPASPIGYMKNPIPTYMVNSFGTHYLTEYALKVNSRIMFASTSEVYGDPLEHPQKESYWGNVNPVGVRSCYDESKRFGEMVLTTQARVTGVDTRIVRIFNTYGPRMDVRDGRVMPNFIQQALKNESLTVHGDGSQTRSFCYVDDLVEYIIRAMLSDETKNIPVNIGRSGDMTVLDLAKKIIELTNSSSEITFTERPSDDPSQRDPDLTLAKKLLDYSAQTSLDDGLIKTIEYFKSILK